MSRYLRTLFVVFGSLLVASMLTGCERLAHELHPERLWRLNRGPAVGEVPAEFSISDDGATARASEWATFTDRGVSERE